MVRLALNQIITTLILLCRNITVPTAIPADGRRSQLQQLKHD
jgi:hypothetical protein